MPTPANQNPVTPRIALALGDPSGIGPELVARLLADDEVRERAGIVVIGDDWALRRGAEIAACEPRLEPVTSLDGLCPRPGEPLFHDARATRASDIEPATASESGGRAALTSLGLALRLARSGDVDAITFAPLNKQALHLAGYGFEDELHWFVHELGHEGPACELNVMGDLWTSRVTSHVALKEVAGLIDEGAILRAIDLADRTLRRAGVERPRIGVAALNPHAGDGGIFGREEIDVIAPAVAHAQRKQIAVQGPFPSDTVFIKARDGAFDAVVTMYHDQGQIAMKLMGFERGVTVQGGLPIPITTPAHGTAFDIVGKGVANPQAIRQAFFLAAEMGERAAADRRPA
ncbi:MAG: 4-hydroxythreonine-4-phosphate dehydrogenase PdxA [Gammaproteobacteria bacterium]|nr:4-hydroxythreonine-4-phosphate dehydrogenase PdxA [Gammaproteobacteria bacterium]